jgi:hypothetical protein
LNRITDLTAKGGTKKFTLQGGILKEFFAGVKQNLPTLQGDKNLFTLKD